jgi:hypothetical protein
MSTKRLKAFPLTFETGEYGWTEARAAAISAAEGYSSVVVWAAVKANPAIIASTMFLDNILTGFGDFLAEVD